jgi:hypothetical protein
VSREAVVVLRDALFECAGVLSNVCGGPEDKCALAPFDALGRVLSVLSATNPHDATDRSNDTWRGDAVLRLAALAPAPRVKP